jgi:hypothetical protein
VDGQVFLKVCSAKVRQKEHKKEPLQVFDLQGNNMVGKVVFWVEFLGRVEFRVVYMVKDCLHAVC